MSVGASLGKTRLGQRGPLPTSLPAVTHTQAPCQICDPALLFQRGLGTCREKSNYIHFVGICDISLRPKNLGSWTWEGDSLSRLFLMAAFWICSVTTDKVFLFFPWGSSVFGVCLGQFLGKRPQNQISSFPKWSVLIWNERKIHSESWSSLVEVGQGLDKFFLSFDISLFPVLVKTAKPFMIRAGEFSPITRFSVSIGLTCLFWMCFLGLAAFWTCALSSWCAWEVALDK